MGTGCTKLTYWNILPNNGWYKATVLGGYNADNSGNISWNIVRPVISHRYMEMYAHLIDDSPILKMMMFLFTMLNDKRVNIPRSVTSPIVAEYPQWLCSRTFLLQHLDSGLPCLHLPPKTQRESHIWKLNHAIKIYQASWGTCGV